MIHIENHTNGEEPVINDIEQKKKFPILNYIFFSPFLLTHLFYFSVYIQNWNHIDIILPYLYIQLINFAIFIIAYYYMKNKVTFLIIAIFIATVWIGFRGLCIAIDAIALFS